MGSISTATFGRIFVRRLAYQKQQRVSNQPSRRLKSGKESLAEETRTVPTPNTISQVPIWQRLGPLSTVFNAYSKAQKKRPYVTQFCSSLAIYFCGDLAAQKIGRDAYDPRRTLRMLTIGAISSLPSYRWFLYLGTICNYSSRWLSLGCKVAVNQIVFTPIFNTYFFGMQSFLSGDSVQIVWERIQLTVPTSIKNSLKLWPIVTAFNFSYVLPQYRSLFAGVIAIGWQSYLSWLNRKAEIKQREQPQQSWE